jgi:hypothetical protein
MTVKQKSCSWQGFREISSLKKLLARTRKYLAFVLRAESDPSIAKGLHYID